MMWIFVTTCLLTLSIVPPAYLQYASFAPFIPAKQKKWIVAGYTICFIAETLILLYLFLIGQYFHSIFMFKKLYSLLWIPYFIWAITIIRPYFFRHIYVLALRTIFMLMLHTFIYYVFYVFIHLGILPGNENSLLYPLELCVYTISYILCLPVLIRYFNDIFRNDHALSTRGYWKYICVLPCLLLAESLFFVTQSVPNVIYFEMLVPRIIISCATLLIALSVRAGINQADAIYLTYERNDALAAQIQSSQNYAQSLNESQTLMEQFYEKRREYLQKLTKLISDHDYDKALALIEYIGLKLNQTKRQEYCKNTVVNAALTTYLSAAIRKGIAVTAQADIPDCSPAFSTDLSMVFSNLIENAVHASEKQAESRRVLTLLVVRQEDMLNILIKNRFDGTVTFNEDGLPTTDAPGHGIGMKSLARFRDEYHANVICTCEKGWFSTYIRLALPAT
ncbi:sensor histidine kinase [uncultured Megasphaera sp.]|uniref:sensor histidine kinase n=1 Tax=uncultured Megasphaera sp. TaxID=165188 RepID=UPI0025EEB086|nr:sensor histidine kinase [uncultured Megasphaera sp.]